MPGPAKSFDIETALERARDVFWRRGYDGTSVHELESELGIGRKSLYDTFGNKRALYLQSLEQYTESVIAKICSGLTDERSAALENLERVLTRLQHHHASGDSRGCLLGVAMAQTEPIDEELATLVRASLQRLERAFETTVRSGQEEGDIDPDRNPVDVARHLVALTQGMALMGRVAVGPDTQRGIVRAALQSLRP